MRKNEHALTAFFLAVLCIFLAADPVRAQSVDSPAASAWTDTDSRLANHYLKLLQGNPEYGNILDLLWDLYAKKNQTPLLLDYIGKAAKEEKAFIPKLIFAHLLRKAEKIDEARAFYDEVASGLPENIPALKALAEISEQQKRDSKAMSYYTRLLKLIPPAEDDGVAIRFRVAAMHHSRGQVKAAIPFWNEIIQLRAHDPKIRSEVIALLLEVGETTEAITELERQAEAADVKIRLAALDELARVYELINDFEGADRAARAAMALLHFKNHQHTSFFERWVKLHERFDKLPQLEEGLKQSVDTKNPGESSLFRLASFYHLTADYRNEEVTLLQLVERLPKSVDYRVRLAELQLANDRYADAGETLDAVLKDQEVVPFHLLLLRVKVDLNAEEEMAAENRLLEYLAANKGDKELRDKIVEFARANYLDNLVEKLLREMAAGDITGSDGDSAPLDLARFLHERGQTTQTREVIEKFINGSGDSATERTRRLHQAALAYRDLDMYTESEAAINEALANQPENIDFLSTRAGLQVDRRTPAEAIKTLEKIHSLQPNLSERIEVDQKIFSLLRADQTGITGLETLATPVEPTGPIKSVEEFRKLASSMANSRREADNETPQVLINYFQELKDQANRLRTVPARYRAAWWAMKLQDNHEVYFQLEAAKQDAIAQGLPPVQEVEEMLLELAVQNDRPENMIHHLETLGKIDPARYDEYRHQWAEAKFKLGSEDVAVRELVRLASKPEASLQTLNTLSKIYGEQGNNKKQIEVWENAYNKANLFEKRRIITQLSTAFIEQKQPQAALKAQLDLIHRESDQIQRRKQFEVQLAAATAHSELEWLKDRYLEAVQKKPFDDFFPEALGRIHLALGQHREAFEAMKKSYYMSGENHELLDELGDLASRLGDLNSAIYYSRQMIARGEGEANIENWENLIRMLEKDFRSTEADLMRNRLEVKFGQDPDFLERLGAYYWKNDHLKDALRIYQKRARLRDWDVGAQFDLALLKLETGDRAGARQTLELILSLTAREAVPNWAENGTWPVIDATQGEVVVKLDSLNFELQTFPGISTSMQEGYVQWTGNQGRREFEYRPRDNYAIRLRTLEELGKCLRDLPTRETEVTKWLEQDLPGREKWWLAHHARSVEGMTYLAENVFKKMQGPVPDLAFALGIVQAGAWELIPAIQSDDTPSLPALAGYLALKNETNRNEEKIIANLKEQSDTIQDYVFTQLKRNGQFAAALKVAGAQVDSPQIAFLLSHVSDWTGDVRKQAELLDVVVNDSTLSLESDGALSAMYQIAVADRYRICDSAAERKTLIETVRQHVTTRPQATELTRCQIEALLGHISGDRDAFYSALSEVTAKVSSTRKPDGDPFEQSTRQIFGWERVEKEFLFYTDLVPRRERESDRFFRAIGGDLFSHVADQRTLREYENCETKRIVAWLNGRNASDRNVIITRALPLFNGLDGRLELARLLEKSGYLREAGEIYYREVLSGSEDFAPLRQLFKTADQIQSPEAALEVWEKLQNNALSLPPGFNNEYLSEQHARLLWYSRDIERLAKLSEPPVTSQGEQPVKTTAHLPYQEELVNAYLHAGQSEALLGLLTRQKMRGEISNRELLLGSNILIEKNSFTEALNWLDQITYARKDEATELKALENYYRIYSAQDTTDKKELKWLSRIALQYRSRELDQKLVDLFLKRGEVEEALSLLRMLHRMESDPVKRSEIQLGILDVLAQQNPVEGKALGREIGIYLSGVKNLAEPASKLAEWSVKNVAKLEEQIPVFASYSACPGASHVARLIAANLKGDLAAEFADLKEVAGPKELEHIFLILANLGGEGKKLAAAGVNAAGGAGPSFFMGDPETQFRFFSRIGDRTRLRESYASLMRMSESYFFFGRSILREYPTLQRHWKMPGVLNELGHPDLASSLYRSFYANIRHHRSEDIPFVEAYLDFLIGSGDFETAERVAIDLTRQSFDFDMRKIVKLYEKWDNRQLTDETLLKYDLTTGQAALIKEWRTALVEGREMVEYVPGGLNSGSIN